MGRGGRTKHQHQRRRRYGRELAEPVQHGRASRGVFQAVLARRDRAVGSRGVRVEAPVPLHRRGSLAPAPRRHPAGLRGGDADATREEEGRRNRSRARGLLRQPLAPEMDTTGRRRGDNEGEERHQHERRLSADATGGARPRGSPRSKDGLAKKYGAFMSDPLYLRRVPALEPSGLLSSAEGLAEFVRHVVELYLCKPNILSLHMVTGLHAFIVLKPYYTEEDFEKALRTHWTSTGVLYLSMKAPPLEKAPSASTSTGRMVSWDALAAHAIGSRADHDIKFVDTCLFLHGAFPGHADLIQRAASTLVKGKGK